MIIQTEMKLKKEPDNKFDKETIVVKMERHQVIIVQAAIMWG